MALRVCCTVVALLALAPPYAARERSRSSALPGVMLWAWERPEDLRSLDAGTGVAFLYETIRIQDGQAAWQPRRQPLRVRPDTPLVAVTRIETVGAIPPARRDELIDSVSASVVKSSRLPAVDGVQIDFDARESERDLYRELLGRVRRRLDPQRSLSITALASWCAGDAWLQGLPVDEVVPMAFRLGPTNEPFRSLAMTGRWPEPMCRSAVGTSLDEPLTAALRGRRV